MNRVGLDYVRKTPLKDVKPSEIIALPRQYAEDYFGGYDPSNNIPQRVAFGGTHRLDGIWSVCFQKC